MKNDYNYPDYVKDATSSHPVVDMYFFRILYIKTWAMEITGFVILVIMAVVFKAAFLTLTLQKHHEKVTDLIAAREGTEGTDKTWPYRYRLLEWKSKVIGTDAMKHPVYESSSNLSNLGKFTALGLGIGCSACQRACTFTCADGNCCVIVGLSSDSTYTATIRSRGPNAVVGGR